MDGHRARSALARLHRLPAIPRAEESPPARLGVLWAVLFGLGWPAVIAASMALEPAPAEAEAEAPLWASLVALALLFAVFGTVAEAARRRPQAAAWSLALGVIVLGLSVSCPASGHHTAIGGWWFTQLGLAAGMTAASGWKLRRG